MDTALHFERAYGDTPLRGSIRMQAQDFCVEEIPRYAPSGCGEHLYLEIQKTNTNTEWVARQLARLTGLTSREVSYAGLKDRRAITRQWFSIHLPGKPDPDLSSLCSEQVQILQQHRHDKKLQRGNLLGNRFTINVHVQAGSPMQWQDRLQMLQQQGFPNYFGEQRFGRNAENVRRAQAWIMGEVKVKQRHLRSLYLSALRSLCFNAVLSQRIRDATWNQILLGEVVMLQASHSVFVQTSADPSIDARLKQGDLHPTGPMPGAGEPLCQAQAKLVEQQVLQVHQTLIGGLVRQGVQQSRRALRVWIPDLQWTMPTPHQLQLRFTLPAGAYATALLTELMSIAAPPI